MTRQYARKKQKQPIKLSGIAYSSVSKTPPSLEEGQTGGKALILLFSAVLFACLLLPLLPGHYPPPQRRSHPRHRRGCGHARETSLGLMYRTELRRSAGCCLFSRRKVRLSFWMKNTPLPLDIIYINADFTIVHIAENTTPYSPLPSPPNTRPNMSLKSMADFVSTMASPPRIGLSSHGVASKLL